jgi:hypothetical protein
MLGRNKSVVTTDPQQEWLILFLDLWAPFRQHVGGMEASTCKGLQFVDILVNCCYSSKSLIFVSVQLLSLIYPYL